MGIVNGGIGKKGNGNKVLIEERISTKFVAACDPS